ncbi:MAG: tripartite tricarboxylate transporter substrate binding protein [Deltaproteobacteria bacterium]|nr:tripartite tricarboxylate transporter substrate binding protein [Deltaproteobacteria bacterium]
MLVNLAQSDFNRPLVCSNKPGGGSALMHGLVAKAKPDGYTLGVLLTAGLTRIPYLRKVPYDPMNDFTPIMQFAVYQYGLCVKADSPWKTFQEFIDYAKKNPGKVTYSTAGTGSGQHLCMEYLAKKEGLKWTHIPYKGGVPAVTACLGGHVTAVAQTIEFKPYVQSGDLRLLAVFGEQRIATFPEIPTLQELGYDFSVAAGLGIVGPKGLPTNIVDKLEASFLRASREKSFQKLLKRLDLLRVERNRTELVKFLEADGKQKRDLIKSLKLGIYSK